jgi:hypothetical protein
MREECSTHGKEMHNNLKERDHMGDPGVDGRAVLRLVNDLIKHPRAIGSGTENSHSDSLKL